MRCSLARVWSGLITASCGAHFKQMAPDSFERKSALAAQTFLTQGITFTVYNDDQGTERIFRSKLSGAICLKCARNWL